MADLPLQGTGLLTLFDAPLRQSFLVTSFTRSKTYAMI